MALKPVHQAPQGRVTGEYSSALWECWSAAWERSLVVWERSSAVWERSSAVWERLSALLERSSVVCEGWSARFGGLSNCAKKTYFDFSSFAEIVT